MHAIEVFYKGWTLLPLAPGAARSYSAMLIVRAPDGVKRALGRLGDFGSVDEACTFALECGRAVADGRDYRKLFDATGRPVPTVNVSNPKAENSRFGEHESPENTRPRSSASGEALAARAIGESVLETVLP